MGLEGLCDTACPPSQCWEARTSQGDTSAPPGPGEDMPWRGTGRLTACCTPHHTAPHHAGQCSSTPRGSVGQGGMQNSESRNSGDGSPLDAQTQTRAVSQQQCSAVSMRLNKDWGCHHAPVKVTRAEGDWAGCGTSQRPPWGPPWGPPRGPHTYTHTQLKTFIHLTNGVVSDFETLKHGVQEVLAYESMCIFSSD